MVEVKTPSSLSTSCRDSNSPSGFPARDHSSSLAVSFLRGIPAPACLDWTRPGAYFGLGRPVASPASSGQWVAHCSLPKHCSGQLDTHPCWSTTDPDGPALTSEGQGHRQSVQHVVHRPALQVHWEVIVGLSGRGEGENWVAGSGGTGPAAHWAQRRSRLPGRASASLPRGFLSGSW